MLLNDYYAKSVTKARMEHLHKWTIGNETFNNTQCIKRGYSIRKQWFSFLIKKTTISKWINLVIIGQNV